MSLVPTREDQAFANGYQQASEAGGMVIDHVMSRLHAVEAERAVLRKALETAYLELKAHDADYHHRTPVEVNNMIVDAISSGIREGKNG